MAQNLVISSIDNDRFVSIDDVGSDLYVGNNVYMNSDKKIYFNYSTNDKYIQYNSSSGRLELNGIVNVSNLVSSASIRITDKFYFDSSLDHYLHIDGGDVDIITTGNLLLNGSLISSNILNTDNTWTGTNTFQDDIYADAVIKFTNGGDNYIYFDNMTTRYLRWHNTYNHFELSSNLKLNVNLWMEEDAKISLRNNASYYLMYSSTSNRYILTGGSLQISDGGLYVDSNEKIYLDGGTSVNIEYKSALSYINIAGDIHTTGYIDMVGGNAIFFKGGSTDKIFYDVSESELVIESADIFVDGTMSGGCVPKIYKDYKEMVKLIEELHTEPNINYDKCPNDFEYYHYYDKLSPNLTGSNNKGLSLNKTMHMNSAVLWHHIQKINRLEVLLEEDQKNYDFLKTKYNGLVDYILEIEKRLNKI